MPIPKLRDGMTREEVIELYKQYGWYKTLEVDWIEIDRYKKPHLVKYVFNADTIPCDIPEDVQAQLTFVSFMPHGVMWTCAMCGKTDGPISMQNGRKISDQEISVAEAWEVIKRTGQSKPVALEPVASRSGRARVIF